MKDPNGYKNGAVSIALGLRKFGESQIKNLMYIKLMEFVEYAGVKNNFSPAVCKIFIDDLCENYYNISIVEYEFVLKKARQGEAGEMYNNLNPIKMAGWFKSYFNNRMNLAEQESIRMHNNVVSKSANQPSIIKQKKK